MVGLNVAEMVVGTQKCCSCPKVIENGNSDVLMS